METQGDSGGKVNTLWVILSVITSRMFISTRVLILSDTEILLLVATSTEALRTVTKQEKLLAIQIQF